MARQDRQRVAGHGSTQSSGASRAAGVGAASGALVAQRRAARTSALAGAGRPAAASTAIASRRRACAGCPRRPPPRRSASPASPRSGRPGAHAAARAVAQVLRAVHRARHAGRAQHALAAHLAVEQEALDRCARPRPPAAPAARSPIARHRRMRCATQHASKPRIEPISSRRAWRTDQRRTAYIEAPQPAGVRRLRLRLGDALGTDQPPASSSVYRPRWRPPRLPPRPPGRRRRRAARCGASRRGRASEPALPARMAARSTASWNRSRQLHLGGLATGFDDHLGRDVAPGDERSVLAMARPRPFGERRQALLQSAIAGGPVLECEPEPRGARLCLRAQLLRPGCLRRDRPGGGSCRNTAAAARDGGRCPGPRSPAARNARARKSVR